MSMKLMGAVVLALGVAAAVGMAQPESKPPQSVVKAPLASVEGLAFLRGSWVGDLDGGRVEEMWSAPSGNNLIGAFRWLKNEGKPMMFELLTITSEPEGVFLRMHHFDAKLRGKEAAEKPITCKMGKLEASRVEFANVGADRLDKVIYEVKEGVLAIEVSFKDEPDALQFKLKKQ